MNPQSYYRCKTWALKPLFCILSSFESMDAHKVLQTRTYVSSVPSFIKKLDCNKFKPLDCSRAVYFFGAQNTLREEAHLNLKAIRSCSLSCTHAVLPNSSIAQ